MAEGGTGDRSVCGRCKGDAREGDFGNSDDSNLQTGKLIPTVNPYRLVSAYTLVTSGTI